MERQNVQLKWTAKWTANYEWWRNAVSSMELEKPLHRWTGTDPTCQLLLVEALDPVSCGMMTAEKSQK